jgi:hypothetical protein
MNLQMVDPTKHGVSILVSAIFVIVILFETSLPRELIDAAQTNIGKVVMALILITMFASVHPIAGVLAILAFWKISVNKSHSRKNVQFDDNVTTSSTVPKTGADDIPQYNNANDVVSGDIGGTLEEEVISNMAPLKTVGTPSTQTYVPVLDTSITATSLDEA